MKYNEYTLEEREGMSPKMIRPSLLTLPQHFDFAIQARSLRCRVTSFWGQRGRIAKFKIYQIKTKKKKKKSVWPNLMFHCTVCFSRSSNYGSQYCKQYHNIRNRPTGLSLPSEARRVSSCSLRTRGKFSTDMTVS